MFDLATQGYATAFHQLVACIISVRTMDEVSLPAALRLFKEAPTSLDVSRLSARRIAALIKPASFYETKAHNIKDLAQRVTDEFGGKLPCDFEIMTSFRGVGPKCANLTLGIACGATEISVDIHVHRVTNRWGFVAAPSPEGTRHLLEQRLPPKVLGRDQQAPRALWQARLYRASPQVLDLSRSRVLSTGWRYRAPMIVVLPLTRNLIQRFTGEAKNCPLVHRLRSDLLVEGDRQLVPVQD